MTARYSLQNWSFDRNASRYLRIDDTLRTLVIGGKFHGRRPTQYSNFVSSYLAINFVLRGRGRYTVAGGSEYELSPGTLFHRLPGVKHSTWYDPESDYAEFYIVYDPQTGDQLLKLGLISDQLVENVGIDPLIFEDFKHLFNRAKLPETHVPTRNALIESIAYINRLYDRARSNRVVDFWEKTISDACALLEHNLNEPLRAQTVAEKLGVSYAALRKHFKQSTGYAPTDFRIRRKLEAAQYALMNASVKVTAREYGYCDSFAFSRQFKDYVGVSPREFQRRMQQTLILTPLTPLSPPRRSN